jgi:hypothetical protein
MIPLSSRPSQAVLDKSPDSTDLAEHNDALHDRAQDNIAPDQSAVEARNPGIVIARCSALKVRTHARSPVSILSTLSAPLVLTRAIAVSFRVNQHSLLLFGHPCE